jgi:hypothetical protein
MKDSVALLHVTPRTVAFHKYEMMKRLGLTTNAELIQFAIKNGLVSPYPPPSLSVFPGKTRSSSRFNHSLFVAVCNLYDCRTVNIMSRLP